MDSTTPQSKKRVIVVNFSTGDGPGVIFSLQKKGVCVVYWVGGKYRFDEIVNDKNGNSSSVIFHDYFNAIQGIPAVEFSGIFFDPPSKELLEKLAECELMSISMMDRCDYNNMGLYRKRRLYYTFVAYWHCVLNSLKPDAILFNDVPHHVVFTYVIYNLAHLLGVKTILCKRAKGIPNRVLLFNNFKNYHKLVGAYGSLHGKEVSIDELSPDIKDYYEKQHAVNDKHIDAKYKTHVNSPDKSKSTRLIPHWNVIVSNIKDGTLFKVVISYVKILFSTQRILSFGGNKYNQFYFRLKNIYWNRLKRQYKREYLRLQCAQVDFSQKYVYIPLHYQPECTTTPMGDVYADQILMVHTVAASLPDDWLIYIKENPIQWAFPRTHVARFKGYYKEMACNTKVRFVPVETSTFNLTEHSQAVATVTGTAGWEALMRSKPVFLFGYPWYMDCDGVFRVSGPDSCRSAVSKIREGYKPDMEKLIRFLVAVDKTTIRAYLHKRYAEHSDLSVEQNVQNIAEAFYNELYE